jgi:hypothetical protein
MNLEFEMQSPHVRCLQIFDSGNRAYFWPFKKSKLQKNRQSHFSLGSPQLL